MKAILLFALVVFVNSFILQQEKSPNYLTFSNTKGVFVEEQELTSFKNFAISASTFYGQSYLDNLKFICTQMDKAFRPQGGNFASVILQTTTNLYSAYTISSVYSEYYASFGPGSNSAYANWSYLYTVNQKFGDSYAYVYTNGQGQGTGFNSTTINLINEAAYSTEGGLNGTLCYCIQGQFNALAKNLSTLAIANNVICQSGSPALAYFQTNGDRWLVTKPKNCYYTIWST